MRLSAEQILHLWEVGRDWHSIDRALLILSVAFPDRSHPELQQLSIGQRDTLLMAVQQQTFGARLHSLAQCPACAEQIEFSLDLGAIQAEPIAHPSVYSFCWEAWELQVRPLNSLDLAAIASCSDVATARRRLIDRCVVQAHQRGVALDNPPAIVLPELLIQALAIDLAAADANSDIQLSLTCSNCQYSWQAIFDIVSYLWIELSTQAKRLLREVDALARSYGWRESDILAMSSRRRQLYLEMVT